MPTRPGGLLDKADALCRAATECHRNHTRHAKLVENDAPPDEQAVALEDAFISDDALATAMSGYETAKGHTDTHADDAWWHKGNMLWHATREYIRRHASCDGMSKRLRQSPNRLAQLTLSYDLEASALLALKMAADAYRAVRPEVE